MRRTSWIARGISFVALLLLPASAARAQEANAAEPGMRGVHRLTLALGHALVAEASVEGQKEWLALASWAIDYDYWLSDRWALGVQNELVIESFVVEKEGGEVIERDFPFAVVPVVYFRLNDRVALVGGVGAEFAGETLGFTRVGAEYGVAIGRRWEVGAALVWDNKWDYYNSWGVSFGVSRLFGPGR